MNFETGQVDSQSVFGSGQWLINYKKKNQDPCYRVFFLQNRIYFKSKHLGFVNQCP